MCECCVDVHQLTLVMCVHHLQPEDWSNCEQLPVEIELGKEFVFHSVFACPVSRDQVMSPFHVLEPLLNVPGK